MYRVLFEFEFYCSTLSVSPVYSLSLRCSQCLPFSVTVRLSRFCLFNFRTLIFTWYQSARVENPLLPTNAQTQTNPNTRLRTDKKKKMDRSMAS